MNKFILAALCIAAAGACGGGGSGTDPDPIFDATPLPDVGGGNVCNPVTQTGCETGEKCTQLTESVDPLLVKTTCVADGAVAAGGACMRGEAGATGFDDCAAGLYCLSNVCTEICTLAPDSCLEGSRCGSYNNLFDDMTGLCTPSCDPTNDTVDGENVVINADCGAGQGCYLQIVAGTAACAGRDPAGPMLQNTLCAETEPGPNMGTCFLNSCSSGFGANLPNKGFTDVGDFAPDGSVCSRFCTPAETHTNSLATPAGVNDKCSAGSLAQLGGGGVGHQCRFIQSFVYNNVDQTAATIGMCVPPSTTAVAVGSWGDCTMYNHDQLVTDYNAATTTEAQDIVFNEFALVDPTMPMTSNVTDGYIAFLSGCVSLAKKAELVDVGGAIFNHQAWAARHGIDLEARTIQGRAF